MWDLTIEYNGTEYTLVYNEQSGYYEIELTAPNNGGIYPIDVTYYDIFEDEYTATYDLQVFIHEAIKVDIDKNFMWIFNHEATDLSVKDIVEITDYEINIDEETNAKSTISVLKKTDAQYKDIIAVKHNNEVVYWGVIDEIQNEDGNQKYTFVTKYITNIFDRNIRLLNEYEIEEAGIEVFLYDTIDTFFVANIDTLTNYDWLNPRYSGETFLQTKVSNVENGIYNFHTWLTNCTQLYNVVYTFSVRKISNHWKLDMLIKMYQPSKQLVDTTAMNVSNYTEVFETEVMAKVIVSYTKVEGVDNPGTYTLYLKTNRTTTTNMNDPNRAVGNITTIYTENYEDARQKALDEMKANAYNHNITFNLDKYIPQGTPIAIKTKKSVIYDTYISSIKITPKKFYEYICGNIRINFIEKLKKEKVNA